jgi:hypothetical protein
MRDRNDLLALMVLKIRRLEAMAVGALGYHGRWRWWRCGSYWTKYVYP